MEANVQPPANMMKTPEKGTASSNLMMKGSTRTRCDDCYRKHKKCTHRSLTVDTEHKHVQLASSTTTMKATPMKDEFENDTPGLMSPQLGAIVAVVAKHRRTMHAEHAKLVQLLLRPTIAQSVMERPLIDPFADLKGNLQNSPSSDKLITKTPGQKKGIITQMTEEILTDEFRSEVEPLPKYNSIGRLAGLSLLSRNVKSLGYLPYYLESENEKEDLLAEMKMEELKAGYEIDIAKNFRRNKCQELAESWRIHFYRLLDELDITEAAICWWFLDGEELDAARSVCPSCDLAYIEARDQYTDFLLSMQKPQQRDLKTSALIFQAFVKEERFNIWHILHNDMKPMPSPEMSRSHERLCAVCFLFDCPTHGGFLDQDLDEAESEYNDDLANVRQYVTVQIPQEQWPKGVPDIFMDPARVDVTLDAHLDARSLFLPCSHKGPCNDKSCSCARDKVSCETYCGCHPECQRRYKGCSCLAGTKQKICFADERCECWKSSRECNPHLCGSCGVLEVLDPVNKSDQSIQEGRCRNNRIQLGIPIRMHKGISQVHGWGLYAGQDVLRDEFIGEYQGEIISIPESDRRGTIYHNLGQQYLFKVSEDQQVDANHMGNKTRFVNNSSLEKNINVAARKMLCDGVQRVMLYAKKNIKAGEELFYDYHYPRELRSNFREKDQNCVSPPKTRDISPVRNSVNAFSSDMLPPSPIADRSQSSEESTYEEVVTEHEDEEDSEGDDMDEDEDEEVDLEDRSSEHEIGTSKGGGRNIWSEEQRVRHSGLLKAAWRRWKRSGRRGRGGHIIEGGTR